MFKTKLKSIAASIAIGASALVATTGASAVILEIDANPFVYVSPILTSSFFDAFTFTIAPSNIVDVTVSVNSLESSIGSTSILSIPDGSVQLWDATGTPAPITPAQTWGSDILFSGIGPGTYGFVVTGTPLGLAGGLYSFSAQAVPVPEPGTLGMLATGGVLLTLALGRNARKKA